MKTVHALEFLSLLSNILQCTILPLEFPLLLKIQELQQAHMPLSEMLSFPLLSLFLHLSHFLKVHNNFPEIHEISSFFHAFPVPFVFLLKFFQIHMFISCTYKFIIFTEFTIFYSTSYCYKILPEC